MQTALTYRTNRDLFSNYYLNEHLPETEAWDELSDEELREAKADIIDLWEREQDTVAERTESSLEEKFIRPLFRKLGIPFEVEETVQRGQRRPDYGFFPSEDAARDAFSRKKEGGDFYKDAVAVADAKRWGRPLDTRGSGEHERDFENPSYQIHVYLQETPARWAVLTDGKKWRLYYGPTSHRLDSYYEIDLPTVLEKGDLEDFKYFYLFFRHGAFLEDSSGECFLDEVYDESNVFAQELGEDLQDNIYEAIKTLSEGFMQYPDNDLSEDDLDLIHDSSLIYLYRLIFVLYAESEGRDLLDTNNEIYEESYSLNTLKQDVAEELDSPNPKYRDWQDNLWDRLDELFKLIDQGSKSRGIPEEDLYIPAYNGGLFRTDPDEDDSVEARFLANHQVGDAYLAEVIELLTRSQNGNGGGKIFVDYSSLDVRHLGSIYEGLLEYQLDVADEPLALEDGEYVPAGEGGEVIVEEGEVHLSTDSGERKATGSYYTPEYVVEYIVEETLGPLVDDIRNSLVGQSAFDEGGFAGEFAEEVFDLKILDPAMGSGHFLTSAIDYLAREIIDAQEKQAAQQGIETVDENQDINWARRQVAQRCIYGVDLNQLAVELAKVSLWLRTLAAEQPLAFLDHHLKTGNSLVGSDIEEIEELESESGGDGKNASLADFGVARKGTIEQLMLIYEDFIAIENQDLADVKQMEAKYDEFERNKLRQRLEAMTNVHTAEDFGLDTVPADAYERMAAALEDNEWAQMQSTQWFQDAQSWADRDQYFHWRLEYPEVFYNEEGSEQVESGFDAIIGNPPYGKEISQSKKDYYYSTFDYQEYQLDRYLLFIEQCTDLTVSKGNIGLIVPNTWLTNLKFGKIRELIFGETTIQSVVRYEQNVFPEATVEPISMILSRERTKNNPIAIREKSYEETLSEFEINQELFQDDYDSSINLFSGAAARAIEQKLADSLRLNDVSNIYNGVKPFEKGKGNPPQTEQIVDEKPYVSEEKEDDSFKPLLRGSLIERYLIKWDNDSWISYGEWLAAPRDPSIFDVDGKILIRQTGDSLIGALDESQFIARDNLHIVIPENNYNIRFLLATINSKFANWYYQEIINPEKGEALAQVKKGHLTELPVPTLDSQFVGDKLTFSLRDQLPESVEDCDDIIDRAIELESTKQKYDYTILLSECINILRKKRNKINQDLLDYLGEYDDGPQLSELDPIPAQGVSNSIVSETTKSRANLRIGSVRITRNRDDIEISISARYKPPEETDKETDRWGYTETDFQEVFTLTNLSETEADLVEAFVPVAVDKAGGFANFRETATKTNSLVDRIKKLTLPKPTDIANDLRRYIEIEELTNGLDARIKTTNDLIDQVMYDFYDLNEEEIATVETDAER